MNKKDIRWEQRFSNYNTALAKFIAAVEYVKINFLDDPGSEKILQDIIKQGLIQNFEYTHELAWNVIKDYAEYQGNNEIRGSRDAVRYAFKIEIIADGDVWMDMIKNRNKTLHTYNEETATEIFNKIRTDYLPIFLEFQKMMKKLKEKEERLYLRI